MGDRVKCVKRLEFYAGINVRAEVSLAMRKMGEHGD